MLLRGVGIRRLRLRGWGRIGGGLGMVVVALEGVLGVVVELEEGWESSLMLVVNWSTCHVWFR